MNQQEPTVDFYKLFFVALMFGILLMQPILFFPRLVDSLSNHGFIYVFEKTVPYFLPFIIFGVYLLRENRTPKVFNWISNLSFKVAVVAFLVFVGSYILQFDFSNHLWSYQSVIVWSGLFVAIFYVLKNKGYEPFFCFTFSSLCLPFGGMLYELPIYPYAALKLGGFFHYSYPLFVATPFVVGVFLVYLLHKKGWIPTKLFWVSIIVYLVHGVVYFCYPTMIWLPENVYFLANFVPRLFGAFVLVTVACGFSQKTFT